MQTNPFVKSILKGLQCQNLAFDSGWFIVFTLILVTCAFPKNLYASLYFLFTIHVISEKNIVLFIIYFPDIFNF